jgi:hypothetical protein
VEHLLRILGIHNKSLNISEFYERVALSLGEGSCYAFNMCVLSVALKGSCAGSFAHCGGVEVVEPLRGGAYGRLLCQEGMD